MSRSRLTIFTEGDRQRGLGHVTRCMAYAEAWRSRGGSVSWVIDGDDAAQALLQAEDDVVSRPWQSQKPEATGGVVLIDSYCAPPDLYRGLVGDVGVFIDDLFRIDYPPGIVVHSAPGPTSSRGDAEWLSGPAWHPLRPAFWDVGERQARPAVERVLIVLGGTDLRNLGSTVVDVVRHALRGCQIDLVVGRGATGPQKAGDVTIHRDLSAEAMRDLMLSADLAVSAAGQTIYELARCGCPAILVGVADNQTRHMEHWPQTGAVVAAGWWHDADLKSAIKARLLALSSPARRQEMAQAGQSQVDGRGIVRLFERFDSHVG